MLLICLARGLRALMLHADLPAAARADAAVERNRRLSRFGCVQVLSRVEGLEPSFQVGLEILDILQPDVEPQCRTTRRPLGRGAVGGTVKWNDEAFEAAL